jgi:hypothetical protein
VPIPHSNFSFTLTLEKAYDQTGLYDTFLIHFFSSEPVEVTATGNLLESYVAEAPKRGMPVNQRYYGSHLASREASVVWHELSVVVVYECTRRLLKVIYRYTKVDCSTFRTNPLCNACFIDDGRLRRPFTKGPTAKCQPRVQLTAEQTKIATC